MKKREMYKPVASLTSGARPMGMVPIRSSEPKTMREPKRSQAGPAMSRMKSVAIRETMLEFATCAVVRLRSFLIVTVKRGGNVYQAQNYRHVSLHAQERPSRLIRTAIIKPSHEKWNARA